MGPQSSRPKSTPLHAPVPELGCAEQRARAKQLEARGVVAIYHLSTKPISRSGGRSATAAAAYRSAERVHDLTTGEVFDYTRKSGVVHAEIVLPSDAARQDINWARDRQQLWNAAEVAEKRKDARVAREYEVALPHELTRAQRVELVRAFAEQIANRYGVVVDFAIHKPHRAGDDRNHHAHMLATTRQVTATGLGAKAAIEWSDSDRAKKGLSQAKTEIVDIRERWASLTNEALQARGLAARVDHRTLEAQGIEREPTTHLGAAVMGLERRGIETEVGNRIREQRALEVQARLERAAEHGRLEREQLQTTKTILDLSGDLAAAKRERGQARSAGKSAEPSTERSALSIEQRLRARVERGAEQLQDVWGREREQSKALEVPPPKPEPAKNRTQEADRGKDAQQEAEQTLRRSRDHDLSR